MSKRNKKIVHVSTVHPSFDTRIFHKECRTLCNAGYEVVLIATHGTEETIDGIRVRPLREPNGRLQRILKTSWEAFSASLRERGELYHFHDPELIPIGVLLKLFGKTVVYDVHEDVPRDILSKPWIPKHFRQVVARVVSFTEMVGAAIFDGIIAATPVIAVRFPTSKTVIVQNFPEITCPPGSQYRPYGVRTPKVVYVGDITVVRGIRQMVTAMDLVDRSKEVELVLCGRFSPPELESEVSKLKGWDRVRFIGWQSRESVFDVLGHSIAGLVTLHPEPNFIASQPNKLFEYMSAGTPVIASDFPLWREIIETAKCGFLVDPLDPQQIANKIEWILEHPHDAETMGNAGQQTVGSKYIWTVEARNLLSFYDKLLLTRRAAHG